MEAETVMAQGCCCNGRGCCVCCCTPENYESPHTHRFSPEEARVVLLITNTILLLFALIGLFLSVYIRVSFNPYVLLDPHQYLQTTAHGAIAVFVLSVVVAVLGFRALMALRPREVLMYLCAAGVMVAFGAGFIALAASNTGKMLSELGPDFERMIFMDYGKIDKDDITKMVDNMHTSMKCCGSSDYKDWLYNKAFTGRAQTELNVKGKTAPDSCCAPSFYPGCNDGVLGYPGYETLFRPDCRPSLEFKVTSDLSIILGFSTIIVLGMAFSLVWGAIFKDRIVRARNESDSGPKYCPYARGLCAIPADDQDDVIDDVIDTEGIRKRQLDAKSNHGRKSRQKKRKAQESEAWC